MSKARLYNAVISLNIQTHFLLKIDLREFIEVIHSDTKRDITLWQNRTIEQRKYSNTGNTGLGLHTYGTGKKKISGFGNMVCFVEKALQLHNAALQWKIRTRSLCCEQSLPFLRPGLNRSSRKSTRTGPAGKK